MPKPTAEQLEKINQRVPKPFTEDQVYVFPNRMIDNIPTSYDSVLHKNLLNKFQQDLQRGTPLMLSHNTDLLPMGYSIGGGLVPEEAEGTNTVTGDPYVALHGDFYIPIGDRATNLNGESTDEIAKAIDNGVIRDSSVGFSADTWECSVCGHDIRDWMECSHFPGETYSVPTGEDSYQEVPCYVIVGRDGDGELIENSLVYAGAAPRAELFPTTLSATDSGSKGENKKSLSKVANLKTVELGATVYQYLSNNGVEFYTDPKNIRQEQFQRSEPSVTDQEKLLELQGKFAVTEADRDRFKTESESLSAKLSATESALTQKAEQVEALTNDVRARDEQIAEFKTQVAELSKSQEVANQLRNGLIEETLSLGVKAQGNAFNRELFEKFLSTLSIEQITEARDGFKTEVYDKFKTATRFTTPNPGETEEERLAREEAERNGGQRSAATSGDENFDDLSEEEQSARVAEMAQKIAKEEGLSIRDASVAAFSRLRNKNK